MKKIHVALAAALAMASGSAKSDPATLTTGSSVSNRATTPMSTAKLPALPSAHKQRVRLVEPRLTLKLSDGAQPTVALTFDACMGNVDNRILDTLVDQKVPATIFVTARWIRHNAEAMATLKAHPDLFEIENHGENHVPAVEKPTLIYGIAAAGSPEAVAREVTAGADAIVASGLAKPVWFRGATAKYTPASIRQIRTLGFKIAGYSVNGDDGSLLGRTGVERRFASAKSGDVIIAHINQPSHAAGEGVVAGIMALKAKGFRFVRLDAQDEELTRTAGN